ncbi:MAG: hypothetical protein R2762_14700 [Bryobacteraceae bacterium]
MRWLLTLLLLAALPILSQVRERRDFPGALAREFDEVTAKTTAWLEVLDNLQHRAKQDGLSLHPQLTARRAMLEAAMDQAEAALRRRDWKAAADHIREVRGHLAKLTAAL